MTWRKVYLSRRHRQRIGNSTSQGNKLKGQYSVPRLPVELLAQIIGYLNGGDESFFFERPAETTTALAKAARVSRLFYELAMPLLWNEVLLWGPRQVDPYPLLKYPRAPSKHVFSYIGTMYIRTSHEGKDADKTMLNRHRRYLSKCLQILAAATSVKSLYLDVSMYNVENYAPELRTKVKTIKNVMVSILRHAANM